MSPTSQLKKPVHWLRRTTTRWTLRSKREQLIVFRRLRNQFASRLRAASSFPISDYTISDWEEHNLRLAGEFSPAPTVCFLQHPVIRGTMVVTDRQIAHRQLSAIETSLPPHLIRPLLQEDLVGCPQLLRTWKGIQSSANAVHHAYHLARFAAAVGEQATEFHRIVEWGGGYGNLAKVCSRAASDKRVQYVIVDTPLFSCIQWLYLASVLGEHRVRMLLNSEDEIAAGVNILPVGLLENYDLRADLFISTWGLNECSQRAQDLVVNERNCFGAKHLLVAGSEGEQLLSRLTERGAGLYPLDLLPRALYAFQ